MSYSVVSAKRKNDAVISVTQDNESKKILIDGANEAAQRLFGYLEAEIVGKTIDKLLPKNIGNIIDSNLDYDNDNSDLASILRRVPDFHVLNRDGESVPVTIKVFHLASTSQTKIHFEILMHDTTLMKNIEILKKKLLDKKDLLPSNNVLELKYDYFIDTLGLVTEFVVEHHIEASVAVVAIDNIGAFAKQYGKGFGYEVIANVKLIVEKTCRTEDVVEYLGHGLIGILMVECNSSNAQVVLNRVRLNLQNSSVSVYYDQQSITVSPTLSIGYVEIFGGNELKSLVDNLVAGARQAQRAGGNRIIEV